MLTKEEKVKLEEMKSLFEQLDSLYQDFNPTTQDFIREFHNEEGSLPHCIRWGLQATEELLEEEVIYEVGTEFTVTKNIDFGVGYIPVGATAKLASVEEDSVNDTESTPFQFDFDQFVAYQEGDEHDGYCEDLSSKDIQRHLQVK